MATEEIMNTESNKFLFNANDFFHVFEYSCFNGQLLQ